jgi:cytochrome c biogenesis protein CcdA
VMSSEMGDDEKEAFMRRAALKMLIATILFVAKFLLIVLALSAVYWLSVTVFPELQEPIMESFVSPTIIVGLTLLAIAYVWARNVIFK